VHYLCTYNCFRWDTSPLPKTAQVRVQEGAEQIFETSGLSFWTIVRGKILLQENSDERRNLSSWTPQEWKVGAYCGLLLEIGNAAVEPPRSGRFRTPGSSPKRSECDRSSGSTAAFFPERSEGKKDRAHLPGQPTAAKNRKGYSRSSGAKC